MESVIAPPSYNGIPMSEGRGDDAGPSTVQDQEPDVGERKIVYLVGNNLLENFELQNTLKTLSLRGVLCDDSVQSQLNVNSPNTFIFDEFEGSFFERLRKRAPVNPRILIYGPPAVLSLKEIHGGLLPSPSGYPAYCIFLRNCSFSITGMRSRERMLELRRKIIHMGGDFVEKAVKVTYLIAEKAGGMRYRDACAIGVSIMKPDWIDYLWSNRRNPTLDWKATENSWKCKAYYSLKIAFEGFDDQVTAQLTTYVTSMDGSVVESNDALATHIVKPDERSLLLPMNGSDLITKANDVMKAPEIPNRSAEGLLLADGSFSLEDVHSPSKRSRFEPHVFNDEAVASFAQTRRLPRDKVKRVQEGWFWKTLQVQYCTPEEPYLICPLPTIFNDTRSQDDFGNASMGSPSGLMSPNSVSVLSETDGTPSSVLSGDGGESTGRRKRKRKDCLRNDVLSSLFLPDLPPRIITDLCRAETTASLGGASLSDEDVSDAMFGSILKQINDFLATSDLRTMSARQAEFAHLVETERNYVSILMNIVKNFMEPCEDVTQPGGAILEPREVKTIFHTILPIYSLHRRLLRDLVRLLSPWSEDNLIGKVYCDHAQAFRRAYEPFINFFEATKEEIRCEEKKNGRFMAFLKIAQTRPECCKQSLTDMMIRPVQRLPSTALILSTLVKRTQEPNPDAQWMLKAVEAINSANNAINEGKRVMDSRLAMFDLYHDIEGCPAEIISANRALILWMNDVHSLSEMWGPKTDPLTIIVFDSGILILKKRSTASNKHLTAAASMANLKSPSMSRKSILPGQIMHNLQHPTKQYKYKFLEMVLHSAVMRVVDILNASCFALAVRAPHETRERVLGFTLPDDPDWPKPKLIHCLAKLAGDAVERFDYETKLLTEEYSRLDFWVNPIVNPSTVMEKASRFANKTRHKVSRALSLSRTPSKLKRTVSQMMSPFSSSKSQPDPDSVSRMSVDGSAPSTPLRSTASTLSLSWFGSRRGDGTPKSRKTISDRDGKSTFSGPGNFTSIQES